MRSAFVACFVPAVLIISSCSVPNMESPECSAAREVVRQYYSLAIGGDPMSNPGVLAKLKALRSVSFTSSALPSEADQFHFSTQTPTSYRVGECSEQAETAIKVRVKVIWRVDDRNTDRDDVALLVKTGNMWLIDRIDVGTRSD